MSSSSDESSSGINSFREEDRNLTDDMTGFVDDGFSGEGVQLGHEKMCVESLESYIDDDDLKKKYYKLKKYTIEKILPDLPARKRKLHSSKLTTILGEGKFLLLPKLISVIWAQLKGSR